MRENREFPVFFYICPAANPKPMRILRGSVLLFLMSACVQCVCGQSLVSLERNALLNLENHGSDEKNARHFAIKPYIYRNIAEEKMADSLLTPYCKPPETKRSWVARKLFYEHFLRVDSADFSIAADPLLDLQYGYDLSDKSSIYRNSRGLQILGTVKDKLSFYTSYLETQARFPSYVTDFIQQYEVVPGMNRAKDFKGNSFDYGMATANISYNPWKFLNLQLGYGKNAFGYGYRSLLLSDNAFQYPFLKVTTTLGRFEYVNLITSFQNLDTKSLLDAPYIWYHGYQKKGGTFNYLSAHATKWLDIGLFEGIIWKARGLKDQGINLNQYIPIIYVNTLRYGLFSENNILLGCDVQARIFPKVRIYGQFALDDLHFNQAEEGAGYQKTKLGYQVGVKWFDIAGIRNLHLQAEYNQVRPYTYGHHDALQSYTHYNQALAHPLGANFREVQLFLDYRYRRIYAGIQGMVAVSGADTADSHWGSNIFCTDILGSNGYNSVGNSLLQGVSTTRALGLLRAGFLFNPKYHLCIEGEILYRNTVIAGIKEHNFYISVGIKTRIFNQYFDF